MLLFVEEWRQNQPQRACRVIFNMFLTVLVVAPEWCILVLPVWMLKWRHPIMLLKFDPGFVRNCWRMPSLEGNTITPITSCPRGRCLLFSHLTSCLQLLLNRLSNQLSPLMWYLPDSPRYPHNFLGDFPNLLVWTLKLCLHSSLRSLLISHHKVPRILLNSPSMLPTRIFCNLPRKPYIPHNLQNSL